MAQRELVSNGYDGIIHTPQSSRSAALDAF